jgi:hypothetical protein
LTLPLNTIKRKLDVKRLYNKDISLGEVIENEIKPYKFDKKNLEKYKQKYYEGAYFFVNNPNYSTPKVLFERFCNGVDDEGFREWFIKEVHQYTFEETVYF